MVEYAGEFFGTMMLVMFGTAANCQYNLSAVDSIARTPAGVSNFSCTHAQWD